MLGKTCLRWRLCEPWSGVTCGMLVTLLIFVCSSFPTYATILTFDESDPDTPISDTAMVPQAYGDNVTALSQGGFSYGKAGEGFTPNVEVSYGPVPSVVSMWTTEYGDLTNVIYSQANGSGVVDVVLTATAGFQALLYAFDLAGWPIDDYTINAVQVFDGSNNPLFSQNDVLIQGDFIGPGHTALSFATPLAADVLRIHFDAANLGLVGPDRTFAIGLDNVRFGQQPLGAPIPEPSALLLFASGGLGLGLVLRRGIRA